MSSAGTVAVIPVKPLGNALRRLSAVLDEDTRQELQEAMLTDVLAACAATPELAGVLVVTSDPRATALAAALGIVHVPDHVPAQGMNAAVELGLSAAGAGGRAAALVLTADLPFASPEDLAAVITAAAPPPGVTLVPSLDGTGTNAMLLRPPGALTPELGLGSLSRHLAQAAARGLSVRRLERPGLALDIDTPADLGRLLADGRDCATRRACLRRRVAEQLTAGSRR